MIHVVLFEPEIPPNTGNIARTCAATGIPLHLIEPLGFSISNKHVRRAGLDYWEDVSLQLHRDFAAFTASLTGKHHFALLTTKGVGSYDAIPLPATDEDLFLLFGPETRGLPPELLARYPDELYRIPMLPEQRSLNLGNAVAVVLYDLLRRDRFNNLR